MIGAEFPGHESRIAAGLAGNGSDCLGYDDDVSRDHDGAVGFMLWLTPEDHGQIGRRLSEAYGRLPELYRGSQTECPAGRRTGVMTIAAFYRPFTGLDGAPEHWQEWLQLPSEALAQAVSGAVFRDSLGQFTAIRERILTGMPEDVRLKKIAARAALMAQSGQYNYTRYLRHGEPGAAALALGEFVVNAIGMAFLLNRRHRPFYKWAFRALRELPHLPETAGLLETLLARSEGRAEVIEAVCAMVIGEIRAQGLTGGSWDYLEPHAYEVMKRIQTPSIRSLHVMEG